MRLRLVVVFSELVHVVESWIVGFECLEESFDLALRGWFSNGTLNVFYAMCLAEVCEPAWAVVAPILCAMVGEDLFWGSTVQQGFLECL